MRNVYKVYNDGGAFIGIRKVESSLAPRRKPVPEEPIVVNEGVEPMHDEDYENIIDPVLCGNECENTRVTTLTEEFRRFYRQTVGMRWKKRHFASRKGWKYMGAHSEGTPLINLAALQ